MFVIEDEKHAEPQEGRFSTLADAIAELKHRAALPWDELPNVASCTNWKNCGRNYEVIEYDVSVIPWLELKRTTVLEVTAAGAKWFFEEAE